MTKGIRPKLAVLLPGIGKATKSALISTRNLDTPIVPLLGVLLVSTVLGILVYWLLMWWAIANLKAAIRSADVFQTMLASDPMQVQGVPGMPAPSEVVKYENSLRLPENEKERRARIIDLLLLLKVVDDDAATRLRSEPSLRESDVRLIADLFENKEFGTRAFDPGTRSSLDLILDAVSIKASICGEKPEEFRAAQLASLTDALAQAPGPGLGLCAEGLGKHYVVQAAKTLDMDWAPGRPGPCAEHFQVSGPERMLSYLTMSAPSSVSDGQLLEALFTSYRLNTPAGLDWPIPAAESSSDDALAKAMLQRFMANLLSEIRADPNVRVRQLAVTVVRGWEQLGMIILSVFAGWILFARNRATRLELELLEPGTAGFKRRGRADRPKTKSDAEAVLKRLETSKESSKSLVRYLESMARNYATDSSFAERRADEFRAVCDLEARSMFASGWPVRTALALIPALGFLGTVRGILLALADIDTIVRAGSITDQAAAVSQIGTSLGLAFATTAVALVLGLAFRIGSDYQTSLEETLVLDCESVLTPLVDPTLGQEAT